MVRGAWEVRAAGVSGLGAPSAQRAQLLVLEEADHPAAHMSQDEVGAPDATPERLTSALPRRAAARAARITSSSRRCGAAGLASERRPRRRADVESLPAPQLAAAQCGAHDAASLPVAPQTMQVGDIGRQRGPAVMARSP
jgi:hypothetical protein